MDSSVQNGEVCGACYSLMGKKGLCSEEESLEENWHSQAL